MLALCFLVTKDIRNFKVWQEWWAGHEDKFNFYVHYSEGMEPKVRNAYMQAHRVAPVPTKWGDISLVQAERKLYETAYANTDNKFFVLLSDTCIPVRDFGYVYKRLMRDTKKGLGYWDCLGKFKKSDTAEDFRPFIKDEKCINELDIAQFFSRKLYTMHQWKALSRRNVADFFEMWQDGPYISLFTDCITVIPDSLAPDELMYINYINHKYHGKGGVRSQIRSGVMTFVDFDKKAVHPYKYKKITRKLQNKFCESNSLFARKFFRHNRAILKKVPVKCKHGKSVRKRRV